MYYHTYTPSGDVVTKLFIYLLAYVVTSVGLEMWIEIKDTDIISENNEHYADSKVYLIKVQVKLDWVAQDRVQWQDFPNTVAYQKSGKCAIVAMNYLVAMPVQVHVTWTASNMLF